MDCSLTYTRHALNPTTTMPIGHTKLNDGRAIPNLAFGSGSVFRDKDVYNTVTAALDAGFRHVDTAQAYHNEDSVGKAIKDWIESDKDEKKRQIPRARCDLWVTTKYSGGAAGPYEELKTSLQKLQLDYVDLYLIHHPMFVEGRVAQAWEEMERVKKDGLARSIGVSNFATSHIKELLKSAKVLPAVNQIRLHPYIYAENLETIETCAKHSIVVEAYGSLFPITQLPSGPVTAALEKPIKRLHATAAQILFLWVRAKHGVIVTTTGKKERLEEYLGIRKLGELKAEEVEAIDKAGQTSDAWIYHAVESKYQRFVHPVSTSQAFRRVLVFVLAITLLLVTAFWAYLAGGFSEMIQAYGVPLGIAYGLIALAVLRLIRLASSNQAEVLPFP